MIQKQTKHIVTYHGRLRFCYRNDTETKQNTKGYLPWSSFFLLAERYRNKTNAKVTYHGRPGFCFRNDTETKQTQSYLPWLSKFL